MLSVDNLSVLYQELRALRRVSLEIAEGNLVALIGSNGAGKTTLMNTVSGLTTAREGTILWQDKLLSGLPPDEICREGVIQVPEGRKLFAQMTVKENLDMGAYLPSARQRSHQSLQNVFRIFPRLAERERQIAGSLSGGEQQMVAVARALMACPKLLMLDEPSLGLAPIAAAEIFQVIDQLNKDGLTVLLVSQEVLHTLSTATYGYVLENAEITLSGPAKELLNDPRIKESYLGL